MGAGKARRPAPAQNPIPPVTEEDANTKLAAQYEEDRQRRSKGATQNRLIQPENRASSGNLLLSQTTTRQ